MKALISGIAGQDGSYLAEHLLRKGYKVFGIYFKKEHNQFKNINHIKDNINLFRADLTNYLSLNKVIKKVKPDELYNLGAQSFVPMSWEQPIVTTKTNSLGPLYLLESLRNLGLKTKFYQASSSEMYGRESSSPHNEKSPFYPSSPYAITKIFSYWMTLNYRKSYNMFASNGILFNHESPRRGEQFVTKKIVNSVAKIKFGIQDYLELGNIDAKRDWGYAKEYVKAMHLILQQDKPDDFVIATGEVYSVREFVEMAFKIVGMDIEWQGEGIKEKGLCEGNVVIKKNPKLYRPIEVDVLVGDYSKAKKLLKWEPKVKFKELVSIMMKNALKEHKNKMI